MGIENEDVKYTENKLLISFYYKNKSKKFFKHPNIVQGEPFSWGVQIENIDDKPSSSFKIIDAGFHDLDEKYFDQSEKTIFVRSLNPGESTYIEIDHSTIYLEGVLWVYIELEPELSNVKYITFQKDSKTGIVNKYHSGENDDNRWMDEIYVQKRMELLQARTNNYILLLTIVTVWQSIFGLKETITSLFSFVSHLFMWLSDFFSWLKGFI
ncbi:hypothetical protein N7V09_05165 [Shewanella seohaensis]|uniref:hypothetical protein n=1 Tax=Shewanella seohaensis TaxID=755175 RepID=UPI00200DD0B1|nr:hypothetical protein [Shewanella seohaensis]MCL1119858.1 hypothetical protein [Shewanella seohaensis]UXM82952.1 hypothetical protein N7V09_05165 [Shewanella seohaensis]